MYSRTKLLHSSLALAAAAQAMAFDAVPDGSASPRVRFRDNGMRTFDNQGAFRTHDQAGNMLGQQFGQRYRMRDYQTRDGQWKTGRTCDSSGVFYLNELERLDQTMHPPLAAVSWGRDVDLRQDVTIADEISSFTLSTFGAVGGLGTGNGIGNGKSWAGKNTTQIANVSVDISKVPHNLHIWSTELSYTIPELESAAQAGRPIDSQKYEAMQLKYQMDIDEQVYYGDTGYGDTGLVNNSLVTPTSFPAGASGYTTWATKTPAEILADVNQAVTTTWANSAWAVMPGRILIPPTQYGQISTQTVSTAGSVSVLRYLLENNITVQAAANGKGPALEIFPLKWCIGTGSGGTVGTEDGHDRLVCYTKAKERVRYPMTGLARTPVQYDGLYHKCTYYGRLGVLEMVYPAVFSYFDGL